MPARRPLPPAEAVSALNDDLGRHPNYTKNRLMVESEGLVQPGHVGEPFQVFVVSPKSIAEGRGLDSATQAGWQFLLQDASSDSDSLASAAVVQRAGKHTLAGINHGWLGKKTRDAAELVDQIPDVTNGSYEMRILTIPALLVDLLWLKDLAGSNDLLIPIGSASPEIVVNKTYTPEEFFSVAQPIAIRKLESDDRPLESSPLM